MLPAARGGAMIVSRGGAACGRLAQLVRAAGLQPAGRRFESGSAHGEVFTFGPPLCSRVGATLIRGESLEGAGPDPKRLTGLVPCR